MQETKKEKYPWNFCVWEAFTHVTGISSDQQPREFYLLHFKSPSWRLHNFSAVEKKIFNYVSQKFKIFFSL